MMARIREMKAEAALKRIGAIISYEHEWDRSRDCGSGLPMPGPHWARRFLGDSFFAKPCSCIIYDYVYSIEYLRWLSFLPTLREIAIIQSPVGDELCEILRDLRSLKDISLHGTLISDAGIARLEVLQNLETLIVGDTAVTQNGRDALRCRLPNCKIVDSVPVMFPAA
jgi:hypothetical protein